MYVRSGLLGKTKDWGFPTCLGSVHPALLLSSLVLQGKVPNPWGLLGVSLEAAGTLQLLGPPALPGPNLPLQGTMPRKTDRLTDPERQIYKRPRKSWLRETQAEL